MRSSRYSIFVLAVSVLVFVLPPPLPVGAAAIPYAGDDAFQTVGISGVGATIIVDRAYGTLVDDAGHLTLGIIGTSVAPVAELAVAPDDGLLPKTGVSVNGVSVSSPWSYVPGESGVYRVSVPATALLFPRPGDANRALTPRPNAVGCGAEVALRWVRLTVPGAPPALLMAGADLGCGPTGPQDVTATWGEWQQWLAQDNVLSVAPPRDGHLSIAAQLPALDGGYAQIRRMYGPDRPDVSPRVTLMGYSMGGLVARQWAVQHPGVVTQFVSLAVPNAGADAALNFFTALVSRCAGDALRDLAPDAVAAFNGRADLAHYWGAEPAFMHLTQVAAVPLSGTLTDGLVTKESALALPFAYTVIWSPDPNSRPPSLHGAVPHTRQIYTGVRAWAQFASPVRDGRSSGGVVR